MEIRFSSLALKQREFLKRSGQIVLQKKLSELINEIEISPIEGKGRAERLKGYKIPTFSRRIDKKNRLIYSLPPNGNAIEILSIMGHYQDT